MLEEIVFYGCIGVMIFPIAYLFIAFFVEVVFGIDITDP